MLNEEMQKIQSKLKEMSDAHKSYYNKVTQDLLYESAECDTYEGVKLSEDDQNQLMYLRKHVNRVVNPVIQNGYSCHVVAKEPQFESFEEAVNNALNDVIDSDDAREAISCGFRTDVIAGIGYITLDTDYLDDKSLSQGVFVRRQDKPCSIMLGRLTESIDGADNDSAVIMRWMDKKKAKSLYGKDACIDDWGTSMYMGINKPFQDVVPEMIFYTRDYTMINRNFTEDGGYYDGDEQEPAYDEMTGKQTNKILKTRKIEQPQVKCCKYVGNAKVYDTVLPMEFIPVIPIKGDVTYIDENQNVEYRGLVKLAKTANIIANMYYKRELEFAKTAPAPQYMVDLETLPEGAVRDSWSDFNRKSYNYLGFVGRDDKGNALQPPIRMDNTPQIEPYIMGREKSQRDIMDTIGLPDVNFGDDPAMQSGRSVFLRQKQGEMATIHYQKNLEYSIMHATRIAIDLIGMVDTKPIIIKQKDPRTGQEVPIQTSLAELGVNHKMFDVTLANGPLHETKQQEAQAMMTEAANNPNLVPFLDLLMKGSGISNEDEMVKRAKAYISVIYPDLQQGEEDELPPEAVKLLQQAEQQIAQLQQVDEAKNEKITIMGDYIRQLQNELQSSDEEIASKERMQMRDIQSDQATTDKKIQADLVMKQMDSADKTADRQADVSTALAEINADLEADMNKTQGEIVKESIKADAQVMSAAESAKAPKMNSVVSGPVSPEGI